MNKTIMWIAIALAAALVVLAGALTFFYKTRKKLGATTVTAQSNLQESSDVDSVEPRSRSPSLSPDHVRSEKNFNNNVPPSVPNYTLDTPDACSLCLYPVTDNTVVIHERYINRFKNIILRCGARFHEKCLATWFLKGNDRCPKCQSRMSYKQILKLKRKYGRKQS